MRSILQRLKPNSPLEGVSRQDRSVLLACFAIAFFFWTVVKLSQTYQATKEAELRFELPPDKALNVTPPSHIEMRLEGTGWNLLFEFIAGKTVPVSFDLRDLREFNLTESQLRTEVARNLSSGDLEILDFNFDGLSLRLEDKDNRIVPVVLRDSLMFANEFQLRDTVRVEPDSIMITGPGSALAEITRWPTEVLTLRDLRRDAEVEVPLADPPTGLTLSPATVTVRVGGEQFTQKTVWLPVEVLNPPADSLHIFPNIVQANVVVGLSDYNKIHVDSFRLVADLEKVSKSNGKNTVPLILERQPKNVRSVQLSQRSAAFYIVRPGEQSGNE